MEESGPVTAATLLTLARAAVGAPWADRRKGGGEGGEGGGGEGGGGEGGAGWRPHRTEAEGGSEGEAAWDAAAAVAAAVAGARAEGGGEGRGEGGGEATPVAGTASAEGEASGVQIAVRLRDVFREPAAGRRACSYRRSPSPRRRPPRISFASTTTRTFAAVGSSSARSAVPSARGMPACGRRVCGRRSANGSNWRAREGLCFDEAFTRKRQRYATAGFLK